MTLQVFIPFKATEKQLTFSLLIDIKILFKIQEMRKQFAFHGLIRTVYMTLLNIKRY